MSTHGQFNTKSPTIKRILREAAELSSTPSADYHAAPLESNLFEWHFTLCGPPEPSPFANGLYHGRIVLPPTYPLRPPSFRFLTPSGRFEPNREICLSISGHHEESWQPAWGIRTALVAIRSFMDTEAKGQLGGIESGAESRKRMAKESVGFKCNGCGGRTNKEIMKEREEEAAKAAEDGAAAKEETVPEELKLGYRDELGKGKADGAADTTGSLASAQETTLAPVSSQPQQAPPPESALKMTRVSAPVSVSTTSTTSSSQTTQIQPQPQPSTAQQAPQPQLPQQQQLHPPLPTRTETNSWLDMAIIGIAVALGIMVIRKFLSITD